MNLDSHSAALRERQRERLPLASERADRKLSALTPGDASRPLLRAAQRARTATQRVVWLQRAASAWAEPLEAVGACRQACAHCCHIPVTISRWEAKLLAAASGRMLVDPAVSIQPNTLSTREDVVVAERRLRADALRTPFPFLQASSCSVYAHRPIACRTLVNLDDDDLLCRHVPVDDGEPALVPYADTRRLQALAVAAQAGAEFAEIRAFFPAPPEESSAVKATEDVHLASAA